MAVDNDDIEVELDSEDINRKDKRIKTLSDKVKEKDDALAQEAEARKKAEADKELASKERDFYKSFNQVSAKHPSAHEYQDKIWEKVKSGYDIEDATISILAKEGKYNPPQPEVRRETVAGGSATTAMAGGGQKSAKEMSQAERLEALKEAEARGEFKL